MEIKAGLHPFLIIVGFFKKKCGEALPVELEDVTSWRILLGEVKWLLCGAVRKNSNATTKHCSGLQ